MVIRWLGAFRKSGSLADSLTWELTQQSVSALAAEKLVSGKSHIHHASVGLLVKNRAILRRYAADVWSKRRSNGKLVATRRETAFDAGKQAECFVQPDFAAIVISGKISRSAQADCRTAAKTHNLNLLRLTRDGRLVNFD